MTDYQEVFRYAVIASMGAWLGWTAAQALFTAIVAVAVGLAHAFSAAVKAYKRERGR